LAVTTSLLRFIEAPDQAAELVVIDFVAEAVVVKQNPYVRVPGRTRRGEGRTLTLIPTYGEMGEGGPT